MSQFLDELCKRTAFKVPSFNTAVVADPQDILDAGSLGGAGGPGKPSKNCHFWKVSRHRPCPPEPAEIGICGADFSWTLICGAGPGYLGGSRGSISTENGGENRAENLQSDYAELIEKLAHCFGLKSREIGSLL